MKEGYDSLITVMEYHHYLLDKNMKPYTFKWGPDHRNSQELDKLYFFTDGIQLAPKASMREWHYYFGRQSLWHGSRFEDKYRCRYYL